MISNDCEFRNETRDFGAQKVQRGNRRWSPRETGPSQPLGGSLLPHGSTAVDLCGNHIIAG